MADKIGYLFPGQGAQEIGMGQDVYQGYDCAREIFEQASDLSGIDLAEVCFKGPADRLNATDVSQVAMLTTSMALLRAGEESGALAGDGIAATGGLSLGEYTALCVAGVLEFDEAVKLVQKRGQYMQAASEANPGTMVVLRGAGPAFMAGGDVGAFHEAARRGADEIRAVIEPLIPAAHRSVQIINRMTKVMFLSIAALVGSSFAVRSAHLRIA